MTNAYTSAWCLVEFIPVNFDRFVVDVREFPFVTSVQVTKNLGMVTDIVISMDAPFAEGLKIMNNELAEGMLLGGTIVRVRMGYGSAESAGSGASRQTEDFTGILNQGGVGLQLTPTGMTGSITATGIGPQAARSSTTVSSTVGEELDRRFPLAGFLPGSVSVAIPAIGDYRELRALSVASIPEISGAQSHMDFIDSALFYANLSWTEESNEVGGQIRRSLRIEKVSEATESSPFRFIMRGGFEFDDQGNQLSYPIISLNPDSNSAVFYAGGLPPETAGMRSVEVDREGNVVVTDVTPQNTSVEPTSDSMPEVPGAEDQVTDGAESNRAIESDGAEQVEYGVLAEVERPETANLIQASFDRAVVQQSRFVAGLTMTLVSFGIPHIRTNSYVFVQNVGNIYSGTYRVEGVTHSWAGTDIETTLTLRSYSSDTGLPPREVVFDPTSGG
jgi:hypothetical protein